MHATSVMMRLIDTAFLPVLPLGHGFRKPTTEGGIAKAERSTTIGGPGGRQRCSGTRGNGSTGPRLAGLMGGSTIAGAGSRPKRRAVDSGFLKMPWT